MLSCKGMLYLWLVYSGMVSRAHSTMNELTFKQYNNLQLDGCQQTTPSSKKATRVSSATQCGLDKDCTAFNFTSATSTFVTCAGSLTQKLSFSVGKDIMLLRRKVVTPTDATTGANVYYKITLKTPLKAGTIIYFHGKYLSGENLAIEMHQNASTLLFHFRANWNVDLQAYTMGMNYCMNDVWGTGVMPNMAVFPFAVNRDAQVYVLVRQDKSIVYIDGVWCCEFNHQLSLETVTYIAVHGYLQVYEFSV